MRRIISFLLCTFVSTFGVPVVAQSLEPNWNQFNEELRPAGLISGSLVAGFQSTGSPSEFLSISAFVPADWAGQLVCVRVWTANGRYEARNEYLVPELSEASELSVGFPTEFGDFLLEQSAEEVAALTSLGECDAASREHAVTAWNGGQGPVQLLLNSFRADLVFVYVGETPEPVQCRPVEAEIRSAYDVACDLEVEGMTGTATLEIFQYTNRQASPSTILTVFIPSQF